jgi:hypothetical protein
MDGWLAPDSGIQPASKSALDSASNSVPTAEANLRLYRSALAATVHALQSAGKQVILVEDTPSFAIDPLLLVRTAGIPARRSLDRLLSPARSADSSTPIDPGYLPPESLPSVAASQVLLQQVSAQLPVPLFDPRPAFCPTSAQCAYRDGETLFFIDSTHISAAGAARALTSFPLPAAPLHARIP